jgi:hypothetical protein
MSLTNKTDAQLRAEKSAILRELSRRRKARKPKVRKVVAKLPDADYLSMPREFCWACGRGWNDRPKCWHAGWWSIQTMHFVHSGTSRRIVDRRLVISGCGGCHGNAHQRIAGWELPRLTDEHCAWLKMTVDPDFYDPDFIAANNGGKVIVPVEPPREFFISRERFGRC